jgi:hypothetical protein
MEIPRKNHTLKLPPETVDLLTKVSGDTGMYHAGVIGNGLHVWHADWRHRTKEIERQIPEPSPTRKHKTINFNLEDHACFMSLLKHYNGQFHQWQILHGAILLTSQGHRADKEYKIRSDDELASVSTEQLIRVLKGRGYTISKK